MQSDQPTLNNKVELYFKCRKLKDLDVFSKSDPQVFFFTKKANSDWKLEGTTEKINNNLNPEFKKSISTVYHFEEIQQIKFVVLDIDKEIKLFKDFDDNDTIGECTTTLGNIISKPGKRFVAPLIYKGKNRGEIEVTAEEVYETRQNILFKINGSNLDKKDIFTSDPYFKIYKTNPANPDSNILVYQSPVIKNTLNPKYEKFTVKLEQLNGGDMFRELLFEFWDYDSVSAHDFIGMFRVNTDELLRGVKKEMALINPKKVSKSSYHNSGIIHFEQVALVGEPSFIDYISGGCEINLIVAIDCTASNGSPLSEGSLHYNSPSSPSQYAKAIRSVGSVLAPYDTDGNIDVVGFGGKYGFSTSHCFPFAGGEAKGVESLLIKYCDHIKSIELSYPTNFEDVVRFAMKKSSKDFSSKSFQKKPKYSILLILTDGEISDMEKTVSAVIEASGLPLSIVIVGVGSSSFSNMNTLDGDDGLLTDRKGNQAKRDIVQFVEFLKYEHQITELASETLREIPSQLVSFMRSNNILPTPQ
ncbi:hypothetical protein DICPUDRAFT_154343 [Dictyostelium purpureum]|uniref:C2 domain-containing protein n=1 Tax=Dictyostelium purpureum TaxID=5786 RepID=F0ZR39_DICPU|nr:uncharacterized protein DICPUDRAFT_154343 [Dictyostelium purpureum]EGC33615.1 hypothetical protein DICPUDRAFT_154343 [Dictyostelium purpureum]|eukprot:XP_003289883.1 hypothetical protein DICPUDRAFT_154343 [Dictyostelium purpureum]